MHQFKRKHIGRLSGVIILPLVAVSIFFADGLRAKITFTPAESLVASAMNAIQDEGLDKTLSAHFVRLNDEGQLEGTISAIEKQSGDTIGVSALQVTLIQRGQIVARASTNSMGEFKTENVIPGMYTLCVAGDDGFLAYGIQVIESPWDDGLELAPGGEEASVVPQTTTRLVSFPTAQEDAAVEITAAVIPPQFSTLQEIMARHVPFGVTGGGGGGAESDSQINVEESVIAGGFQVSLQEDGSLVGRVAPLASEKDQPIRLREMNAFLLLDDEIYQQVKVDPDGNFAFEDVDPDVYGFAAAGEDGFAALSLQVKEPVDDLNSNNTNGSRFSNASSIRQATNDVMQVAICLPEDMDAVRAQLNSLGTQNEEVVSDMPTEFGQAPLASTGFPVQGGFAPTSFNGGGFGDLGGFSGGVGGGGGFGIGSLAGLAELGLAAFVISEIVDEIDDDAVFTPAPISPFATPTVVTPTVATPTVTTPTAPTTPTIPLDG